MTQEVTFTVAEEGERLDRMLAARLPDVSRTQVQELIKSGEVTVNDRPRKPAYLVEVGDRVSILLPEQEEEEPVQPEPIPLNVVYEDDSLLAVDKPAGMVVHPAPGHRSGTLVNALLYHYPKIAQVGPRKRAGIVHRLDKDTSGILLIARTSEARALLQQQFKRREVHKTYLALVEGQTQPPEGIIKVPIGRDPRDRKRMAAVRGGRRSVTHYEAIEYLGDYTLLEVHPRTGRTHQVRVHLSWLGYPLVGDRVYGRQRQELLPDRHFLHASELRFTHPTTGKEMVLDTPLPSELEAVLERLR